MLDENDDIQSQIRNRLRKRRDEALKVLFAGTSREDRSRVAFHVQVTQVP
jgi:hypothetical protein